MNNTFYLKNFISVERLTSEDIQMVFDRAGQMKLLVEKSGGDERLKGKILAALFFEPSSRTFSSFITAMQRLGGGIIPLNGMQNTSVAKGETLEDTARVFSSYADCIVLRHQQAGSVLEFAKAAKVPVINAGDGVGEHPSQALLDSYTMSKHFQDFSKITVGMAGDLLNGRTVHSLTQVLVTLGVKNFVFVSPEMLRMPKDIIDKVKSHGASFVETEKLTEEIQNLDVLYATRVQKERFADLSEYDRLKHAYIIDNNLLQSAKKTMIVMHPLPRVGEILPEIDSDPRAIFFTEEVPNGLYVRMAILDLILRK